MATLSDVSRRCKSAQRWLKVLQDGLDGRPHSLPESSAKPFEAVLRNFGLEFFTVSRAAKQGLTLKRGAKPVASRYYGAPLSRYADLYLREQFTAAPDRPTPAVASASASNGDAA